MGRRVAGGTAGRRGRVRALVAAVLIVGTGGAGLVTGLAYQSGRARFLAQLAGYRAGGLDEATLANLERGAPALPVAVAGALAGDPFAALEARARLAWQAELTRRRAAAAAAVGELASVDDRNQPQLPLAEAELAAAATPGQLDLVRRRWSAVAAGLVRDRQNLAAVSGGLNAADAPSDIALEVASLGELIKGSEIPVPGWAGAALDAGGAYLQQPLAAQLAEHGAATDRLRSTLSRLRARLAESWAWKVQLPADRIVAFYGNPLSPGLGALGQGSPQSMLGRLDQEAGRFQGLDPRHPVIEALDLVTPVAQPDPGPDSSYAYRTPDAALRPYVEAARSHRALLFFDMQVGRSRPLAELAPLLSYLEEPNVSVALDPEFDLSGGGVPGRQIGTMRAAEINAVVDALSALVTANSLPTKLLVIHQFRADVLADREAIQARPGVQLVLCIDGVGPPGAKVAGYREFTSPDRFQPGFKLFYTSDQPLMSEAEVLALDPQPALVMYQ